MCEAINVESVVQPEEREYVRLLPDGHTLFVDPSSVPEALRPTIRAELYEVIRRATPPAGHPQSS